MASRIAWLDASDADQRRMREILMLFAEQDSRDELGIGSLRDSIADGLFPGTSTLLTRARYLMFVPWCFQYASSQSDQLESVERVERRLISGLRDSQDFAGLMGARSGESLKTLPSAVYWAALRHYNIIRPGCETRWDAARWKSVAIVGDDDDATRKETAFSATLPDPPAGFPDHVPDGFTLTNAEAGWLRDRILERSRGTLLAHLITCPPSRTSKTPWNDESALGADENITRLLDHARNFSIVMQGAAFVYNLLLAEEYELGNNTRVIEPVARYRAELEAWSDEARAHRVDAWNIMAFWQWYAGTNTTYLLHRTRDFVSQWFEIVSSDGFTGLADNPRARSLIRQRERAHKGAQARIGNRKRIQQWQGSAGAGRLVYRWPQVRAIVLDIHDGLERNA